MVAKKGVTLLIYFLVVLVTLQIISATDVGFITKTNPNAEVMQVFSDMGLTVEVIKDQDVLRKNLNDYRFLFIDDGILRNTKSIPVYNYRSIVMNRYYGDEFGLTDVDGISQIASNSPLQVKKGNQIQTVYTQAFENIGGGAAIPYYYLDDKNKANFTGVARTYIGGNNGFQFGDVVATANPGTRLVNGKKTGAKMCFFGISKSKYWTQNAKLLFEECTGFVASVCDNDLQCSDNNEYTVDICENPGTVHSECKHYPIECLSESDCGTDGFEGNNFCSGNSVKRNYINYTCNNPGTRTSSCSSVSEDKLIQQCSELCVEGACVDIECFNDAECNDNNQYTQDKCLNPGTITSVCDHTPIKCLNNLDCNDNNRTTEDICKNPGTIDSFCTNNKITCFVNTDCGTDGFVNQPLCSDGSVIQDYKTFKCNNPGTSQSSCTNTVTPTTKEVCANSCQNGECVVINCKKDSDCNDNNLFTKDTCKFPATPQSYCFYEDIECFNKGDCGVDGFIGGNYCSVEGDAVKDYKTFSCNNAGTPQSSCSNVVAPKVTDDCSASEMCSNGICETITCSRNSDCGINGYVGDSYCSTNGDIVRDFKNYKCNNAGTSQSYCSSNITINVQQECTGNQICVGRQQNKLLSSKGVVPLPDEPICVTIKCTTDSNCNDNNPRTVDKCVNPGTSESFCRNTPVNCLEDLDCGITGYTGNEYCSSDDIYKKFQTSTCLNPGTVNSYCNINTRDRLIQDCDDGNPTTIDSCSEVGGIARCNNERIICNRNSDCGSDGYIGNNYCSVNGDSVRDYKLYTCSNPGTPQSSCSNRVEQRLIDDCTSQEICTNGICDIPQECRELEDYGMKQGFYGEYFNYPRNHSDMNLPFEVLDNEVLGDPLSDLNNWDRDWYNDNNGYYRFSRIDSNLNFGENFFPFDGTRAEEIEPYWNHDYHFGAHWKGMVKVVEPGAYKFSLNSDDDTWVYIDGKLVINNGMVHTPDIKKVTSVNLEGGEIIDVFFAERHVARSHMNLEIESGVTIIPVKDECPLPDVDSVYQCPSGTEKIYVGSTNLIANNSTYAGTSKRNGYPLGPGRYIVEIKDGALSPWNNNVGNNGPIEDGWWVGKTWLSKVNIASFKNNKFENSKITTGYYSTKQEAVNSGKGLYKIINLDWKNGDKNLYLWLADESIDDNRGNVEVELYYCNKD